MKLTVKQHEQVVLYLQHLHIDSQELFEEFYDHIICSYESRLKKEPELDINTHIWHRLLPEFGGVGEFKKVIKKHKKALGWNVSKGVFITGLSAFKERNLLYSFGVFLAAWGLMATAQNLSIMVSLIIICFALPMAMVIHKICKAKQARLPPKLAQQYHYDLLNHFIVLALQSRSPCVQKSRA